VSEQAAEGKEGRRRGRDLQPDSPTPPNGMSTTMKVSVGSYCEGRRGTYVQVVEMYR
jgi:hypothetical protein